MSIFDTTSRFTHDPRRIVDLDVLSPSRSSFLALTSLRHLERHGQPSWRQFSAVAVSILPLWADLSSSLISKWLGYDSLSLKFGGLNSSIMHVVAFIVTFDLNAILSASLSCCSPREEY